MVALELVALEPVALEPVTGGSRARADGFSGGAAGADAPARRDNLLVTGLARAMRDAAIAAREEATVRFAEETKARIEAIHGEAATSATSSRRAADGDISSVRDWSKAEMARIREEADGRIAARRRRLELEVDAHAALVEHRIEAIGASVTAFGNQMDEFFERLLGETDPTRLAGLADQMPEPPRLDDLAALDAGWVDLRTLDAEGAAAAEAEAFADLADDGDAAVFEASASPESGAAEVPEGMDAPEAHVLDRLAQFTGPAMGLDGDVLTTQVAADGLVSVARIAGFKRALARLNGVRSVAVASGPEGDFVFTVQHAAGVDLPSAIPDLDGFAAIITGMAEGLLSVTVTETERAG